MTIGERIAKCRKDKNLSQEYIAEMLDVSRQAVSKWENDQSEPDTGNLILLARLFGVSVEYLANGEEENVKIVYVEKNIPVLKIIGIVLLGLGGLCSILGVLMSFMFALGIITIALGLLLILLKKEGLILGTIIITLGTILFILQGTIWGIDVPIMCSISVVSVGIPSLTYAIIKIVKKIKSEGLIRNFFSNKNLRNKIIAITVSLMLFVTIIIILVSIINTNHKNTIEKERWFSDEILSQYLVDDLPKPKEDSINLSNEKILLNMDTDGYNDYALEIYNYLKEQNFKHIGTRDDILYYDDTTKIYEFIEHDEHRFHGPGKHYDFKPKGSIDEFMFIYSNLETSLNGEIDFYVIHLQAYDNCIAYIKGKRIKYNTEITIYRETKEEGYKYRSYNITDDIKTSSLFSVEYPTEVMKDKEVKIKVTTEISNFSDVFSISFNGKEAECISVGDNSFEFTFIMPDEDVIIDIVPK